MSDAFVVDLAGLVKMLDGFECSKLPDFVNKGGLRVEVMMIKRSTMGQAEVWQWVTFTQSKLLVICLCSVKG